MSFIRQSALCRTAVRNVYHQLKFIYNGVFCTVQIFARVVDEVVDQRFASCMVARPHMETNTLKRQLAMGLA